MPLSRISFYNFIQRPLYRSKKERPNDEDYKTAWNCFVGVIDILQPTDCIFLGVRSTTLCKNMMDENHIDCDEIIYLDIVDGTYPRVTSIRRNSMNIPIVFIKHPSAPDGFTPAIWHDFLKKCQPIEDAMNWLN